MLSRVSLALLLLLATQTSYGQDRPSRTDPANAEAWRRVEQFERQGLPRSAAQAVDSIYAASRRAGDTPQLVRALIHRLKYTSVLEENVADSIFQEVREAVRVTPQPGRAVLHSVLAELYVRYLRQHRWQTAGRTDAAGYDEQDVETWTARKLAGEAGRHYRLSLQPADTLQRTPLAEWETVLAGDPGTRPLRPTLYDLLAHRALDFFAGGEAGLTAPERKLILQRPEYFLPARDFVRLALPETEAAERDAVRILQDLIGFHLNRQDPAPLVDADLRRLRLVHRHSVVPERDSLFVAAHEELMRRYAGRPVYAEVAFALARWYAEQGERYGTAGLEGGARPGPSRLKQAFDLCGSALERFPGSDAARRCGDLRATLLQKHLTLQMPAYITPGLPALARLDYRNLDAVHVRIVRVSEEERRALEQDHDYERRIARLRQWAERTLAASDEVALRDDGDLAHHATEIKIPALSDGSYLLLAAPDGDFSAADSALAYAFFQATPISYVVRPGRDGHDLFVLHRETGRPLEGAQVRTVYDARAGGTSRTYRTDADGHARLAAAPNAAYRLVITHGGSRLSAPDYLYGHHVYEEPDSRSVTFFTDRAIYRPGQTIHFKALLLLNRDGRHEITPRHRLDVRLRDANGQEVQALQLTTNEFGTASGTFAAPRGLIGQMMLESDYGVATVLVEEYKRPRFEVVLDPPKGTYVVGDTVRVTGTARAYAGATLGEAQVAYRVVRRPRLMPWAYGWWRHLPVEEVEIARDTVQTTAGGAFAVAFPALPDLTLPREADPVFTYHVYVDVTDVTGETRSAETSAGAGYRALELALLVPDRLDKTGPAEVVVRSTNRSGVPAPAEGRLVVLRLDEPDRYLLPEWWPEPDRPVLTRTIFKAAFPHEAYGTEADPAAWAVRDTVLTLPFRTGEGGADTLRIGGLSGWASGSYRFEVLAQDPTGEALEVERNVVVFSPREQRLPYPMADWFVPVRSTGQPGETAAFLIGSAAGDVRVLVDVEHDGEITDSRWLRLSNEQKLVELPIREEHRGGFRVQFTFVRHNRIFQHAALVSVPHSDRELRVTLATFRDRLRPGGEEEWKVMVAGPKGEAVAAEMVAALYDASLDAFAPHAWYFQPFGTYYPRIWWQNASLGQMTMAHLYAPGGHGRRYCGERGYEQLNWFGFGYLGDGAMYRRGAVTATAMAESVQMQGVAAEDASYAVMVAPPPPTVGAIQGVRVTAERQEGAPNANADTIMSDAGGRPGAARPPVPGELDQVQARRNLQETAFFFPHLETDADGAVSFSFTVPEALTRWKLLAFAHTKALQFGQVSAEALTQKELMVTPNAPRFFREGDTLAFTARVDNLSDSLLAGRARLLLFDAVTMEPVDTAFGNVDPERSFRIGEGGSEGLRWTLRVPEQVPAVLYRVVAEAGGFADGEEAAVPVLANRMLVTETLPLPVSGAGAKAFTLEKLLENDSPTLRHHRLTLEFTPNPAWLAVQALPYLMETTHEGAEQVFSRFYANSIAEHVVRQNPQIERVFAQWRSAGSEALASNLEKNEELKTLLLEQTPWVLDAEDEAARKQRIALLFDPNTVRSNADGALRRLAQLQLPSGAWPWFEGMHPDRFITQHIVSKLGHLRQLGVLDPLADPRTANMLSSALRYLDGEIAGDFSRLKAGKADLEAQHIGPLQIHYLYARSLFPELRTLREAEAARTYWMGQARRYWLEQDRYFQGLTALALHRTGDRQTPQAIVRSLREFALVSEEMGMYWKLPEGYSWYHAPVETQALLIEVFHEVAADQPAVDAMKQWLLKQKQTQNWRTTKATAEAVYALLRGAALSAKPPQVVVQVGDEVVEPAELDGVEAGTGYFRASWAADQVEPAMGRVVVRKEQDGVAWGALYWQYFEQLDRITPHNTPLSLEKALFLRTNTATGPLLVPLAQAPPLGPGDLLTVRLILRSDRDLEYVHLQDLRASGLEPVNVLSGMRYQDGLGYYESTRDAATNFYFDRLPKGTYVFEYPLRVAHAGAFSNGISTIQCYYAPEFAAHSAGTRIAVQPGIGQAAENSPEPSGAER